MHEATLCLVCTVINATLRDAVLCMLHKKHGLPGVSWPKPLPVLQILSGWCEQLEGLLWEASRSHRSPHRLTIPGDHILYMHPHLVYAIHILYPYFVSTFCICNRHICIHILYIQSWIPLLWENSLEMKSSLWSCLHCGDACGRLSRCLAETITVLVLMFLDLIINYSEAEPT